jgi:hypothetical protein
MEFSQVFTTGNGVSLRVYSYPREIKNNRGRITKLDFRTIYSVIELNTSAPCALTSNADLEDSDECYFFENELRGLLTALNCSADYKKLFSVICETRNNVKKSES